MAHGGYLGDGDADDGIVVRPETNDPHPDQYRPGGDPDVAYDAEPYGQDECLGKMGHPYAYDDELAAALAAIPDSATVIMIFDTCHAGGQVGGAGDLDHSDPADNEGLYVMMSVPEQGLGIAVGSSPSNFVGLLTIALADSAEGTMTAEQWFQAALDYGTTNTVYTDYYGGEADYYFWPQDNYALPDAKTDGHWTWLETYMQLRPGSWSSLDGTHSRPVFGDIPEPGTIALFGLGLLGLGARLRRRKQR
jgi:hypothetical protein